MVIRISDKTQNYSKVTKLLVKPIVFSCHVDPMHIIMRYIRIGNGKWVL